MKTLKKYKKIIIFIVVIFIVIISVGLLIITFLHKKDIENEKKKESERAIELINNNYLYSYIIQGNVKVADGYVIDNNIKYYYVEDETLSSIKSIEDINNLINNTFIDGKLPLFYEKFENGNKYLERNGNLYVAKNIKVCSSIKKYTNKDIRLVETNEDKMQIELSDQTVYAYKENDNWFLGTNNNYCQETKSIENNDENSEK